MKRYVLATTGRLAIVLGVLSCSQTWAQDDPATAVSEQHDDLRAAIDHVRRLELTDLEDRGIDLIDRPLLAFTDPARRHSSGSVWAWGKTGRPVAFLELFKGDVKDKNWVHSVTLTAPHQVKLKIPSVEVWQPAEIDFNPHLFPSAPTPDKKAPARLRQLKELARRFTAHEFWEPDNSRFELRLLVQPVLRYRDPAAEIQDGAAFIIAHGTNPETVLLIEALGPSLDEARWHFALARSSNAEAHVELDGQEVWTCARSDATNNGPTRNYWLFGSPTEPAATDE